MENIEFIAAKDLPTTETTAVDVLCVDPTTNAMMRKPLSTVEKPSGGGLVITLNREMDMLEEGDGYILFIVNSVTRNEVAEIVLAGGTVWVNLASFVGGFTLVAIQAFSYIDDDNGLMIGLAKIQEGSNEYPLQFAFPNGDWAPPTE